MVKKISTETKYAKEDRATKIRNCKECNGAPPKDTFDLQGVCGEHCTICLTVVTWARVGNPTLVKKVITTQDINNKTVEISVLKEPGVNFNSLEL